MHSKRIRMSAVGILIAALGALAHGADIPANTWVRIADCPGDAEGREIPPGRAATWVYEPVKKVFLRYGGYTPRFSNAMDQFDPATGKWKRLFAEDENYPAERPGGGCNWEMRYDEKKKRVILGGGMGVGFLGSTGIWSYDPAANTFTCISRDLPKGINGRVCTDFANNLVVAQSWPQSTGMGGDVTMYCTLDDGKWQQASTPHSPQPMWGGHVHSMTFDASLGRVIAMDSDAEKNKCVMTWSFDGANKKWERMETTGGPSARTRSVITYDPDNKVILLHGLHPGTGSHDQGALNDTWVLDTAKKEWKEIKTPGPIMKNEQGGPVTLYTQAVAYDTDRKRFMLADPDLGVWAFRYDPKAEPGKECIAGSFVATVGQAATNAPAEGAADKMKEIRQKLPSPLNPRLEKLDDNTLIRLGGGIMPGDEVGWCYEPDAGVFFKYGGCGNNVNPFWGGYGNNLSMYDPGTEHWIVRRSCDIAGALRPGTGCTRSIVHDSSRKLLWFFGGAGSGPQCPMPGYKGGNFNYDAKTDRFTMTPNAGTFYGHNTGLTEDPDHLVAVFAEKDKNDVFDIKAQTWNLKESPGFPGAGLEYRRMAYISSKKVLLSLSSEGEGEKAVNRTMAYDAATNRWTDLAAKDQPPSRHDKYGLVYDKKNDVAILLGGGTSWNGGWRGDMWAYIVKENRWEKITPKLAGDAKEMPGFSDNMPSGYDERHNAIIFLEGNSPWAYRYKK